MTKGLIADIGATNARFALADGQGIYEERVLKCVDYAGLIDAIRAYLGDKVVRRASVAIAGPVTGDRFSMTNHPWAFSVQEVQEALGLDHFHLMNDFKALALAVPHLKPEDVKHICGPQPKTREPIGIIGPGTGLGVASLVWDGVRYIAVPGEGGHVTMPAKTQREFDVFQALLQDKYSHISAERVCSGKGLVNLYNGLRIVEGRRDAPDLTPEDISRKALDQSCPLCAEALDMMIAFLGRVAGNLALTLGAFGGLYIAGGIAGKLGDAFYQSPLFVEEFTSKGRFSDYMKTIPALMITHPLPAFVGLQADLIAQK